MKNTWIAALSATALLTACNAPTEDAQTQAPEVHEDHADHSDHDAHDHAEHDAAPSLVPDETGFGFAKTMIRTPPGGRDVTAGYFDIVSATDDAITAARTDAVSSIELHTHVDEDGVMVMKKLDEVVLPAGEVVSFKPKGLHLMLFGADGLELDQTVVLTLEFASGATRDVEFKVKNLTIDMNHDH